MYKLIMNCLGCASVGTLFMIALPFSAQASSAQVSSTQTMPDNVTCQAVVSLTQGASLIYQVTGTVPATVDTETPINPIGTSLSVSIERRDRSGTTTTILSNSSLSDYEQIAPDADYSQIPFTESFRAQPNDGRRIYAASASVHGLYASLRPISDRPQQMQIVHYLSAGQAVRSTPGSCEVVASSTDSLTEPPLKVVNEASLPPMNAAELSQLSREGANGIERWISIAGVGATTPPTEFTATLQALDQQQQAQNPDTAPFLGLWKGEPPASGYSYYLSILPTSDPNQVCIVEYQQGQKIAAEIEPATFTLSKATVTQGSLLSPRLRSIQTASRVEASHSGIAKFLAVLKPTTNNPVSVFSLTDQSTLYNRFSPRTLTELSQALLELNCSTDVITAAL